MATSSSRGRARRSNTRTQLFAPLVAIVVAIVLLVIGVSYVVVDSSALGTGDVYVTTTGDDGGNDCEDPEAPCGTIAHALSVIGDSYTLYIAPGTYSEGALTVDSDITISGQTTDPNAVVIDADGVPGSVFSVSFGNTVAMSNLTIMNGDTTDGGGINNAGSLSLTNTIIRDNVASGYGGGIENFGALSLTDSVVRDNSATSTGGGIDTYYTSPITLTRTEVSGNSSGTGGGIWTGGEVNISNSTVSGNTASLDGGGIYSGSTTVRLSFSTVAANIGENLNGNAASEGIDPGIFELDNTIVADPVSETNCAGGGIFTSGGYNLDTDGTCSIGGPGDQTSVDPLLGSLAFNGSYTRTHALGVGSPAADAADGSCIAATCPTVDQRGVERPQYGGGTELAGASHIDGDYHWDIGAYEIATAPTPSPTPVVVVTPVPTATPTPLPVAITPTPVATAVSLANPISASVSSNVLVQLQTTDAVARDGYVRDLSAILDIATAIVNRTPANEQTLASLQSVRQTLQLQYNVLSTQSGTQATKENLSDMMTGIFTLQTSPYLTEDEYQTMTAVLVRRAYLYELEGVMRAIEGTIPSLVNLVPLRGQYEEVFTVLEDQRVRLSGGGAVARADIDEEARSIRTLLLYDGLSTMARAEFEQTLVRWIYLSDLEEAYTILRDTVRSLPETHTLRVPLTEHMVTLERQRARLYVPGASLSYGEMREQVSAIQGVLQYGNMSTSNRSTLENILDRREYMLQIEVVLGTYVSVLERLDPTTTVYGELEESYTSLRNQRNNLSSTRSVVRLKDVNESIAVVEQLLNSGAANTQEQEVLRQALVELQQLKSELEDVIAATGPENTLILIGLVLLAVGVGWLMLPRVLARV